MTQLFKCFDFYRFKSWKFYYNRGYKELGIFIVYGWTNFILKKINKRPLIVRNIKYNNKIGGVAGNSS